MDIEGNGGDCTTSPKWLLAQVETIGRAIFLLSKRTMIKNPPRSDHQWKTILGWEVNFCQNHSLFFFNFGKTFYVHSCIFFTWQIRCTFPNPNWWAWCTQPWNRTTSHNLCCQKDMPQISLFSSHNLCCPTKICPFLFFTQSPISKWIYESTHPFHTLVVSGVI